LDFAGFRWIPYNSRILRFTPAVIFSCPYQANNARLLFVLQHTAFLTSFSKFSLFKFPLLLWPLFLMIVLDVKCYSASNGAIFWYPYLEKLPLRHKDYSLNATTFSQTVTYPVEISLI